MEKERSKVFLLMGHRVGIKNQRINHRGIVAKKYLEFVEDVELREFALSLPKIELGGGEQL